MNTEENKDLENNNEPLDTNLEPTEAIEPITEDVNDIEVNEEEEIQHEGGFDIEETEEKDTVDEDIKEDTAEEEKEVQEKTAEEELPSHLKALRELRLDADLIMQKVRKGFGEGLVYDRLFLAKCWLGEVALANGAIQAYLKASNVKDIPKTIDVADNAISVAEFSLMGKLDQVNSLRDQISALIIGVKIIMKDDFDTTNTETTTGFNQSIIKLTEARMELGKQLSKLRR